MSNDARVFWAKEGGNSVAALIDALGHAALQPAGRGASDALLATAANLTEPVKDWRAAATAAGWSYDQMARLMQKGLGGYRDFETADWERLCVYEKLDVQARHATDYFMVSESLADQLIAAGEKVAKDFSGMHVWVNTVEGPVHDHPVIVEIAQANANRAEIAALAAAKFEIAARSYTIEIDHDRFIDLMDSESYVTDNAAFQEGAQTLLDKLDKLPGVRDIDHNGHFGGYVFLTIDTEHDTDELKQEILKVIDEHLAWCATLEKVEHAAQRRSGP